MTKAGKPDRLLPAAEREAYRRDHAEAVAKRRAMVGKWLTCKGPEWKKAHMMVESGKRACGRPFQAGMIKEAPEDMPHCTYCEKAIASGTK